MHLELGSFPVDDVQESDRLSYADGVLGVDTEALRQLVLEGGEFADVSVHVVRPGDQTRLIHVIDAAEPRYKPAAGSTFPGFCGPVQMVGEGATHRLAGVAVVTTSDLVAGDPVYAPEAIIDMSGSAADLTPFSRTINVVLELEPHPKYLRPDTPDGELQSLVYRRQIRATELKVASHLARATEGLRPERVVPYELSKPAHTLPRVAYLLHDIPWIYGAQLASPHDDAYRSLPTLMHPNEVLDGALVSNRDYEGCSRDATYFYQNPSILSELYRRHGVDLDFVGVVLFTGGPDMDAKRLACEYAYKLLRMLEGSLRQLQHQRQPVGGVHDALPEVRAQRHQDDPGDAGGGRRPRGSRLLPLRPRGCRDRQHGPRQPGDRASAREHRHRGQRVT
jgi:glycine reductase